MSLPTPASDTEGMESYETLPAKLDLPAALEIYKKRGYDLLLADAAVLNALGNLQSARQFANPSLGLGYGRSFGSALSGPPPLDPNAYTASVNDNALILDELAVGKRRLREAVAQAGLDSQKMSREDAQRTLVSAFKQQWVAVLAAQRQLQENQRILDDQQKTLDLIQTRFRAGAASEVDVSQQQTATYEAAQQVAIARQAEEQAKEGLAFLLGVRGKAPAFEVDLGLFSTELPAQVRGATADSLHDFAYAHRPDVVAQRLQVTEANLSITLAKRNIVPDFALGVGYTQQGSVNDTAAVTPPTVSVDLGVTLPLFYQQKGEITMANANLRSQQVTLAKLEAQVLSDVDTAWSAFLAAHERKDRLEHGYLAAAKTAADLTRIQYEKGAASLVDYLVAEQAYIATVQEYVQSLNDFWTAIFQLEAAVGKEFKS